MPRPVDSNKASSQANRGPATTHSDLFVELERGELPRGAPLLGIGDERGGARCKAPPRGFHRRVAHHAEKLLRARIDNQRIGA